MKLPFQKKQSQTTAPTMPPEVQQYYQAERRERTGIAWLLAIGTLLVTIAIIVGLFFGGRWVYRKLTHHKNTVTTSHKNSGGSSSTKKSTNTSQNSSGSSSQSSSGSTSSGSASGGSYSTAPSSGTSQSAGSPNNSSSSTPTGSTNGGVVPPTAARTNIPNTGPGDTVAIFFGATAAGYLLHRFILAKKR